MKYKTHTILFAAVCICIAAISCNQSDKKDEPAKTDTTTTAIPAPMPDYNPDMDPVKVEAPFLKFHKDTLGIKLYDVTLKPGDSVGLHTHPDHVFYVVQGGKIQITPKDGEPMVADLPTGMATVFPAQTHQGKNVGTTTVKLLVADVYRPRN